MPWKRFSSRYQERKYPGRQGRHRPDSGHYEPEEDA